MINCHTHTFTGDHVPPYLGKKMLPLGLGYIFTIPFIVRLCRWYYRVFDKFRFKFLYKSWIKAKFKVQWLFYNAWLLASLLIIVLTLDVILILFYENLLARFEQPWFKTALVTINDYLIKLNLLPSTQHSILRVLIVVITLSYFKTVRKIVFLIAKWFFKFLRLIPGPETLAYVKRYLNIGRFAFHHEQSTIYKQLTSQYPNGTKFVVLPMDFDYMEAGSPESDYTKQLEELEKLKANNPVTCLPFIFADPRRIEKNPDYAKRIISSVEKLDFRGIKTYPALGYYPFDEHLLPIMLWACENEIPVLNHCIRGTIYFRGEKKREWNTHPLFMQNTGIKGKQESLLLSDLKNSDFANQFTHPLNYLCLLDETRLRKIIKSYKSLELNALFGYTNENTPLKKNLRELKICFGHFGGDDEWMRYLESDRYHFDNVFTNQNNAAINFTNTGGEENLWKYVSWFSIIRSLMVQYPKVYADISYILHEEKILNLLKYLMTDDSGISDRILFGSDFYVVRSEKSDKQMLADISGHLSDEQFIKLTDSNPAAFLYNKVNGSV